jgi:hypothetical protein
LPITIVRPVAPGALGSAGFPTGGVHEATSTLPPTSNQRGWNIIPLPSEKHAKRTR